jgi:hypothetical protein
MKKQPQPGMSNILVIRVGLDVHRGSRIPENFDVVTPLEAQTEPSPFNSDVVNALEKPVSGEFINGKMVCEGLSAPGFIDVMW